MPAPLAGEAAYAARARGLCPLDTHAPPGLLRCGGAGLPAPPAALLTGPPERQRAGRVPAVFYLYISAAGILWNTGGFFM